MSRSLKKGPYVDQKLMNLIQKMNRTNDKKVIKTYVRRCSVHPEMVGHTFAIHNGKNSSRFSSPKTWWGTN